MLCVVSIDIVLLLFLLTDSPVTKSASSMSSDLSEVEKRWRDEALDYTDRFCGHCNTTTDIKEANFFGRYAWNCQSHVQLC